MNSRKSLKLNVNYSEARSNAVVRLLGAGPSVSTVARAINVLRVGYWFESLRQQTNHRTAYGVGKEIQPDTYKQGVDGDAYHHNVWVKYAQGLHVPGPHTIQAGDRWLAGSGECLGSAAWKTLNTYHRLDGRGDALMRHLQVGVQQAVYDRRQLAVGRYKRRASLSRTLEMLEAQADLDGIAALILLLREANEAEDRKKSFQIGRSLHANLLMAGCSLPLSGIFPELLDFLSLQIFPLASGTEVAFNLDRHEMTQLSRLFLTTIQQLEDREQIEVVNHGPKREWHKLLLGKFGFDLKFAFAPRLKLIHAVNDSSEAARAEVASRRVVKEWAMGVLREGRVERFIPSHVWEEMAVAR